MNDAPAYAGAPRWAKIFGSVLIVLALVFVILQLTGVAGRHGPGRHMPFARETPAPGLEEHRLPPGAHQPSAPDR